VVSICIKKFGNIQDLAGVVDLFLVMKHRRLKNN
jgi:hypothetical protein